MPLSRITSASIDNSAISAADIADGTITAAKIISVANTQITGNIISSQITSDPTLYGNVSVTGNLTTTGNTILGDASTDTLNVGNGGLVKDASGNVGIGTSSPVVNLNVAKSSDGVAARFQRSSGGGMVDIETYNAIGGIGTSDNIPFRLNTNNTERMRIDSSGNVLVGTTSIPSASVGGARIQGGQANAFFSSSAQTTGGYNHINFFNTNGLIGSISTGSSTTTYSTSSDYRLKENVLPMVGALDKVALLKPVTYKWKVDGSDGQGFIAHELDAVVPGCVTGEKDGTREEEYEVTPAVPAVVDADGVETTPAVQAVKGTRTVPSYQGVDTSFLVATLTAAIQELKAIVDAQATRIAALES